MSLLASIYALIGADLSQLDRQFASAVKKGGKAGADLGREFQSSLKRSLSSGAAFGTGGMAATMGLDGVGSLLDSLKMKFAAIGQVGGIDYAAQIQRQSVAYTKLFGSASKARDVIRQIQKDSIETGTSSLDNLALLRKFTALPVDPMERTKIARTASDTAAAYGFTGAERNRLADNIGDIFGNGFDRAQSNQFQMLGINVEKTLGLGLGKTFKNEAEALAGVKGMSATEQGNAFIRGLEKQFGGMGKQTAEGTLLGRLEQAKELALQAGEASGALAVKLLTPLAGGLVSLAGGLKAVNEATGGGAGLITMLVMGGAALYSTITTGWMAWKTLQLLNKELKTLSVNGGLAAMVQRASGGSGIVRALPGSIPPVIVPGMAAAGAAAGARGIVGRVAMGAARFAGPVGWALAAYEAANFGSGYLQGQGGMMGRFGAAGQAGLGALFDIKQIWNPLRSVQAGWKAFNAPQSGPGSELSQAAKDLQVAAVKVGNLSAIGGNARVNSALQTLESAYALQGAF